MTYRAKPVTMGMAYPDMLDGDGIMTDLAEYELPWDADPSVLDLAYYNHSAGRMAVPMVKLLGNADGSLPDTSRSRIAHAVYVVFSQKWARLYADYAQEYAPIQNYNVTERETTDTDTTDTGTRGRQGTQTGTLGTQDTRTGTVTKQGTDTGTVGMQETHTGTDTVVTDVDSSQSGSDTTSDSVYGFNSSAAVPDSSRSGTSSATASDDSTQTDTRNLADSSTETRNLASSGTETRNLADSSTETRNLASSDTETRNLAGTRDTVRTMTKAGNIGVTTTQAMLLQDMELWQRDYFYNIVFNDIDSMLTLSTYPRYSESMEVSDEVL